MSDLARQQPEILDSCPDWLVVNKPSGWHCVEQPSASNGSDSDPADTKTLERWLRDHFPELGELPEAGLVHRLDRLTSGCVIVGRSTATVLSLVRDVRGVSGRIRKTYLALVAGQAADGEFQFYFRSRHRRSRKISIAQRGSDAECGRCQWRVARTLAERTLLEVELVGPGKRHQIRAGLAHLGHPLLGDVLYGGPAWAGGFGLHAWRVDIFGRRVEAPIPTSWGVTHGRDAG